LAARHAFIGAPRKRGGHSATEHQPRFPALLLPLFVPARSGETWLPRGGIRRSTPARRRERESASDHRRPAGSSLRHLAEAIRLSFRSLPIRITRYGSEPLLSSGAVPGGRRRLLALDHARIA